MHKTILFLIFAIFISNITKQSTQEIVYKRKKIQTLKEFEKRIKLGRRWQYDTSGYQQDLLLLGGNIERNPGMSLFIIPLCEYMYANDSYEHYRNYTSTQFWVIDY